MVPAIKRWWVATNDWTRRGFKIAGLVQLRAMTATAVAPRAVASTNAAALDWTGVADSFHVPLGRYYLASINILDQASQHSGGITANPESWLSVPARFTAGLVSNSVAAFFLTFEAGIFIAVLAIGVWLYRLASKSIWVTFFGALARPFVDAIFQVVHEVGLVLWLLPAAVFAGAYTIITGSSARGKMMILSAFAVAVLGAAFLADPVSLMYGPHGLLESGRAAAFEVAEVAVHNGAADTHHAARDAAGQLDIFSGNLITAVARRPFQLWQYGHVLSGKCDTAFSTAMLNHVSEDAPIKAMLQCGDYSAANYAAHLDGSNVWLGLLLCGSVGVFTVFLATASGALVMVPARAMYRVIKAPVESQIGVLDGPGRAWMLHAARQFAFMFLEMFAYTLFVCIAGMSIGKVMTGRLPTDLGGDSPVAKALFFGCCSCVAIGLFRMMRAELFGMSPRLSVGRLGLRAAEAAAFAVGARGAAQALKGLRERAQRRKSPPWEELESKVAEAESKANSSDKGLDTITTPTSQGKGSQVADSGHTTQSSAHESRPQGSNASAPHAVPQPTSLTRPQGRRDTTGPAGRRRRQNAPSVAGTSGRKTVPTPAVAAGNNVKAGGLDTITTTSATPGSQTQTTGGSTHRGPGSQTELDTINRPTST